MRKQKAVMSAIPPFDQATFLQGVFEKHARKCHFDDPLKELICKEHVDVCRDFDLTQMQDSWSWRNAHIARELATILVDDKGDIKRRLLFKAIQLLEENLYSLGPGRFHDASRQQHIVKMLKLFYDNQEHIYALKRISRPEGHDVAIRLIRETLFLPDSVRLTDAHARRATLSALLTSLRQNVGSCFATAPAIMIQQDQHLQFFSDISQLLGTGRLIRVIEGVEYIVPLSVSWGVGDLYRPFYLSSLGRNAFKTLAFSPGLQAAFITAGLIEKKQTRDEKRKTCEQLLKGCGLLDKESDPFILITPDQIIKAVLLHVFSVTEQEVDVFRERPTQQMIGEIVVGIPLSLGEKGLACHRFIKAYEHATGSFKALTDNALLKSWEFTLASLSESKADFAKWNLYASLGVQPEEPHGIGKSLYEKIQEKIQQLNEQIEEFQSHYDHLFAQAKYLEGRMSRASTDSELGWVRAEYQIRKHEINRALSTRDEAYDKGRRLQSLYPALIEFYGNKIREYFQEVYDAQMLDVSTNPYDDSPAGFRLLYKHGRSNTALWTMIQSAGEYIQHLTSFFVSTEIELNQLPELEGLQKEVSELITTAITTIKRPEFLESSFFRLARAYQEPMIKDPLENLDKVKRKPWSYISGGTMGTLVSCYWGGSQKPVEEKRWIENETEFLAFLIDTMKELPISIQQMFQKEPEYSMLSFSPTHAFLCKPGWKLFRKGWESETYTYTWIRDAWVFPQQRFLDASTLDNRMMDRVIQQLLLFIPIGYRPVVKNALKSFTYSMAPSEFRENVLKTLSYEKWLRQGRRLELISEELDSILYRFLPLFPEHQLRDRLEELFEAIDEIDDTLKADIFQLFDAAVESVGKYKILTAEDLRNIAKGLLIISLKKTRSSIFYHQKIVEAMQKTGLCYPEPILFADTNWVKNVFGFTVSPGTGNVEFWRFDACGTEGRPLSIWKHYLNGKMREEWGLYTNPHQYGQF